MTEYLNQSCQGSEGSADFFTDDEMKEDFIMFGETLENEHRCWYEFTSKTVFDRLLEKQNSLLERPMQLNKFYKMLTSITARTGCCCNAVLMPGWYCEISPENLFPLPYFSELHGNYSEFGNLIPISENHFSGYGITHVVGKCFSTNPHFHSLIKYHKVRILVGSERVGSDCCSARRMVSKLSKTLKSSSIPEEVHILMRL